jgi:NADH dehydrogenase [ubiquinone] 1 alpha subcomplex assembly factor 7
MTDVVPPSLADAPIGSLFEHCPASLGVTGSVAERLALHGFAALVIDYGHQIQGTGDTLQAMRGHQYQDVFREPGDADLTTHVDFTALASAARKAGAAAFGPITQGSFLSTLGIEARTDQLAANKEKTQADLLQSACRRLIDAQGMGTLFKVLALTDGKLGTPAGFE